MPQVVEDDDDDLPSEEEEEMGAAKANEPPKPVVAASLPPASKPSSPDEDASARLLSGQMKSDEPTGGAPPPAQAPAPAALTPRERFRNKSANSRPTTPRGEPPAAAPAAIAAPLTANQSHGFRWPWQGADPGAPALPFASPPPAASASSFSWPWQEPSSSSGHYYAAPPASAYGYGGYPAPAIDVPPLLSITSPAGTPSHGGLRMRTPLRSPAMEMRHRAYTMRLPSANASLWELQSHLLEQEWMASEDLGRRCGFCAMSGALHGITSKLYVVRDVYGGEVGEAADEAEAKALIGEMLRASPQKQQKYTVEAAWAGDGEMRADKKMLLMHVQNSLAAMARAIEAIDRARRDGEPGSFVVCDVFNLPTAKLQELGASDAKLEQFLTGASLREPLLMLQKALSKNGALALLMPMPEAMMQKQLPLLRKLFPARVLVAIAHDADGRPANLALQLLAAITTIGAEAPRRALAVFVGGGVSELSHMAFCARNGVRLLLLQGSGRLVTLLCDVWPHRGSTPFDPVEMQSKLSITFARPAEADSVDDLRVLLSQGEVVIHPLASSTAKLERLCVQQLSGDKVLRVAQGARDKYLSTSRGYSRPNHVLTILSIVLALASTVVAIIAGDYVGEERYSFSLHIGGRRLSDDGGDSSYGGDRTIYEYVLMYACASLPVLLAVVDSIEGFMGTAEAAAAVERAAGLVTQSLYLYRCRAGDYSDIALVRSAGESNLNSDLSTLRQMLLTRDLTTIAHVVDASGALISMTQQQQPAVIGMDGLVAFAPRPWYAACLPSGSLSVLPGAASDSPTQQQSGHGGASGEAKAIPEQIDGDAYVTERVAPELEKTLSKARNELLLVLLARVCSFAAAAVGTAIAVAAFSSIRHYEVSIGHDPVPSPSYIAITVASSTAFARMLQTTRVEARRRAHARAASALNAARVRWEALPAEDRAKQSELDRLVLSVEQAIEATLPPASSDVAARKASSAAQMMQSS